MDFLEGLEGIEDRIRRGEAASAARELAARCKGRIPRADVAALARLWRKAGRPEQVLRLLARVERRDELEMAEYGAALVNVGAISEGVSLLSRLDGKRHPRIWLLRTFAHVRQWDWEGALPLLRTLSEHPGLAGVDRVLARTYLATALLHGTGELRESRRLLEQAMRDPRASEHARKTALLLLGQNHAVAGDFRGARELLAGPAANPLHAWMARQWLCLIRLQSGRSAASRRAALLELRREVRPAYEALGAWEWARSCEVFPAEITGDRAALERLYFGTPYLAFKRRMVKALGGRVPESAAWNLGAASGVRTTSWVDVKTGATGGAFVFKSEQLPHRVLERLAADLIRPVGIAELHEAIYPGESFRPFHSPARVHQGLKRLRAELREAGLPLGLEERREVYRLVARPGESCQLRFSSLARPDAATERVLRRLSGSFGDQRFLAREAARVLEQPLRSAQRSLTEAARQGWVESVGAGPGSSWRVRPLTD